MRQLVSFSLLLVFAGTSFAGTIVVGYTGSGIIATEDFATGREIASFVPDGSLIDSRGRAVEVVGNTVYYASVSGGIHVAPYNNGLGGADLTVFPNPRPSFGVQDLDYSNGVLYALTGYFTGLPIVYALNPADGSVISSVAIQNHPNTQADGFTVLPNGNFLINDGDASTTYREYNALTGMPASLVITFPATTAFTTGVDYNPSDGNLYFAAEVIVGGSGATALLKTTLTGTPVSNVLIGRGFEDISVVVPEPLSFALCGGGIIGLILLRRRLSETSVNWG